ncbi:MAG: 2OG-Fe(II) oxygenase, partial [Burkholderiales bacterium]|nr:2OG-Fe(II) oxygenase [Burkholderiales bacterium]
AGACRARDWGAALDLMARAAGAGSRRARAQLELLAAESAPGGIGVRWQEARAAIDLNALLAIPPKRALAESPRVRSFERYASPAVCDWMIAAARGQMRRAQIYDAASGGAVEESTRTNRETDFDILQADLVLTLLRERIAAATGLPTAVMELTKVLHYRVGERFEAHYDYIDPAAPGLAAEIEARGQRLATFLVYLNDDFEGGETAFLELGLRHRGRRGDALMFANVDLDGRPDRRSLHAGLAPRAGEKWLLSQWIRDRVARRSIARAAGQA